MPKADSRIAALEFVNDEGSALVNLGFKDNVEYLPDIVQNELFSFRIKWGTLSQDGYTIVAGNVPVRIVVGEYELDSKGNILLPTTNYLMEGVAAPDKRDPEAFFTCDLSVNKTLSKQDLLDKKYGIFI